MKKVDLILILTIILAITIAVATLSSCTNKYNLALVKRNNTGTNAVVRNNHLAAIPPISYDTFNKQQVADEVQLVVEHAGIPSSINQNIVTNKQPLMANEAKGIDKNLIAKEVTVSSYYPTFNELAKDQNTTPGNESKQDFFLYIILAIFLPPVCVGLWEGGFTTDFWISLILTLCFWIPGVIFALYIILR
jgi:uncharacterized membrane protein YqaE (UPF0057 family)